jgi:hypothetical protein
MKGANPKPDVPEGRWYKDSDNPFCIDTLMAND